MRAALLPFILACGSATGCARSFRADTWWRVRTEHVRLQTDLRRERALRAAAQLEILHRAMAFGFY